VRKGKPCPQDILFYKENTQRGPHVRGGKEREQKPHSPKEQRTELDLGGRKKWPPFPSEGRSGKRSPRRGGGPGFFLVFFLGENPPKSGKNLP